MGTVSKLLSVKPIKLSQEKETLVLMNFRIKPSERDAFKDYCAASGLNMSEVLCDYIRSLVQKDL